MPHAESDDVRNILLNQMPTDCAQYVLSDEDMAKWDVVMKLRQDVNGVLELARAEKRIGKALEAKVTVQTADEKIINACQGLDMAQICIVSAFAWEAAAEGALVGQGANYPQLTIGVAEASGEKCPRCWMHSLEADENGLCKRCSAVVAKLDVEI